jgi:glycosyltransferase involved in cell wall biosynthesis
LEVNNLPNASGNSKYPLVSIVTPAYNAMPFILETIESVQCQDYPAIEHIIMDGGSTDGTQEILAKNPCLTWRSEPDKGQSEALNKGFRMARGEIIGWLNADDTYQPGAVSYAVEYLQTHPDVDLVYSDVQVIDEHNQPVRLAKAEPFTFERLLVTNIVKQPTVFMRKRVLDALGGVKENLHYVMDYEFWLRAGASFNLHYLPGITLANFRYCIGTKSHERPTDFLLEWMEVLTDFETHPDLGNELREKIIRAKRQAAKSYYLSLAVQAAGSRERYKAIIFFFKACLSDWMCVFQISMWKLFFRTVFGIGSHHL